MTPPGALGDGHPEERQQQGHNTDDAGPLRYIRVAAWVLGRIDDGTLKPGEPVPSINKLVTQHGFSRETCAKGIRMLEKDGVLFRVPGLGFYVAPRSAPDHPLQHCQPSPRVPQVRHTC